MKTFVTVVYSNISKTAFWLCLLISIVLLVASFLVPPLGSISPSVLQGVGEIFAFATLGVVADAVRKGSDITFKKGDAEVTINNEKTDDPE